MKKKSNLLIIISVLILIIIVILSISYFLNTNKNKANVLTNSNENTMDVINNSNGEDYYTNMSNNTNKNLLKNGEMQENRNISGGKLTEEGITINAKPITYNQQLSTKLNIAYMLKYNINHDVDVSTLVDDMDRYINQNKPKTNGMWIENKELLEGDPLGTDRFKSIIKDIGIDCSINSDGFVEKINSNVEMCKLINQIIDSNKLVMIAFSPTYYAYIENYDNKANVTDTEDNYVSFEASNNIYPYIITGKCDANELEELLKQIVKDIK